MKLHSRTISDFSENEYLRKCWFPPAERIVWRRLCLLDERTCQHIIRRRMKLLLYHLNCQMSLERLGTVGM